MSLNKYLPIYKIAFFTMMTYRWECFFAAFSSLLMIGFMYYLWGAIFLGVSGAENIGGFQSTFVYVAMGIAILVSFNSSADMLLSNAISSGDIVRDLIRPLNFHLKIFVSAFGGIGFRIFLVFIPSFVLVYLLTPPGFFNSTSIGLFLLSLPGALLILFHLDVLTGLISVRTEASWGIRLAKDYLIMLCSGALIPFHFLPENIKHWFMLLPFQGICHTPLYLLSHPNAPASERISLFVVQFFWVVALTFIVKFFINRVTKNIEIYGG